MTFIIHPHALIMNTLTLTLCAHYCLKITKQFIQLYQLVLNGHELKIFFLGRLNYGSKLFCDKKVERLKYL